MKRPQSIKGNKLLEWYMSKVTPISDYEKECWVTDYYSSEKNGRVTTSYKGKTVYLYRVTWELWNDREFPKGLIARHMCDNPRCFNPLHIQPGTPKENANDIDRVKHPIGKKTSLPRTPNRLTLDERLDWWSANLAKYNEETGCLEWLPATNSYATRKCKERHITVPRLACARKHDLDYDDYTWVTRHTCSNKKCINPDHLIPGSNSDNMFDEAEQGRGNAKLTAENVRDIVRDWIAGGSNNTAEFHRKWSQEFNVAKSTIVNILPAMRRWNKVLREFGFDC